MSKYNTAFLYRSYLDNCTLGKILIGGNLICYTVELPYLSNKKNISCVPEGEYLLKCISTINHKDSFFLENIDLGVSWNSNTTRTEIEIHIFNFPHESSGCIGPGLELHPTHWGVSHSAKAMKKLNSIIKKEDEWKLIIL